MAVFESDMSGLMAVQGEAEDLAQVFERYSPAINYFFMRRGFQQEESKDLTQETFLNALRGLESFRGEAKIETWLLRIAANVYKNRLRSQKTQKRDAPVVSLEWSVEHAEAFSAREPREVQAAPKNPQDLALQRERSRMLREAVSRLPARMRRSVLLRIDKGLKYREIAVIMRVSVDTVKTQLHQARLRLKEELQEYYDLEEPDE